MTLGKLVGMIDVFNPQTHATDYRRPNILAYGSGQAFTAGAMR